MMQIKVLYFAGLREDRGCESELLQVEPETTPEAVYRELRERYRFRLPAEALQVAVNEDFADWKTRLNEGDELVFLPPMAGG